MIYLLIFTISLNLNASEVSFDTNVEDLYITLKKEKVTNIVSAVKLFDNRFFDESQYAIMFRSLSIQPSSYQNPRILLFGKDRKLRVGINHHIGEERNLEILQYRSKSKVWELREIKFNNGKVSLTKANPSICMSCHGNNKITPSFKGKVAQINEYTMDHLSKGRKPDISHFRKLIKKDPIYSRLKSLNKYLSGLGF
jgi:hypothetical protein